MKKINIAIDGPSGVGKSTISDFLAEKYNMSHLDTGAMYRAMAYFLLQQNIEGSDEKAIEESCCRARISIEYQNGEQVVLLNGKNVNPYLRSEEVGNMASVSSANPKVRQQLLMLQRTLAQENDVVMDGRDIGTTILPNAQVKIYLTASADTRARRRSLELTEKGIPCDLEEIRRDIIERDERDMNREVSPLRQADDAVLVDSSNMTIEEVADRIIRIYKEKIKGC